VGFQTTRRVKAWTAQHSQMYRKHNIVIIILLYD